MSLYKSEVLVILTHLAVRGSLALLVGGGLALIIKVLIQELGGEDSDPAMTAILGGLAGALGIGFGALVNAVCVDVLGYLRDRLGTRTKPDDGS